MSKHRPSTAYLRFRTGKNPHSLGKVVAERDPELELYYVNPDKYVSRALDFNDSAVFFIGPKGAGKSAILQMVRLKRAADESRIINISPDDLAFSALANISANTPILSEVAKHQWLFKSLWDYILSLEVLRREFKDKASMGAYLKELVLSMFGHNHDAEAKQLLRISLGDDGSRQSLSSTILQLVNEVELSAETPDKTKVSGKAKLNSSKASPGGGQLWLLSLINSVAKKMGETVKSPYHILIDDLDLHWRDTPTQNAFIAALFLSLRNFSKPPYLKCAVAIRDQIFRRLPLTDRDKYQEWVCDVEWEEPNLQKMIERRICSHIDIASKDVWGGLFPKNAFSKMLKHSYGRPREAIRLATLCVAEADRNKHPQVTDNDVDAAILKFSESRILEIASEFSHEHSGLEYLIRKMNKWPKEFQVAKLLEIINDAWLEIECGEEVAKEYPWVGGYLDRPEAFARILLECSILLFKTERTANPCLYDLSRRPDVKSDTWVCIHPAFWHALSIE